MTAEVVNLRRARKQRARVEADRTAAANRIAHGMPAQLRRLGDAEEALLAARLEAHRRDIPDQE